MPSANPARAAGPASARANMGFGDDNRVESARRGKFVSGGPLTSMTRDGG